MPNPICTKIIQLATNTLEIERRYIWELRVAKRFQGCIWLYYGCGGLKTETEWNKYIGAIAVVMSLPIFTKFYILDSKLNFVVFAKIHPICAQKMWNRMKICIGTIHKSDPIPIKFGRSVSGLHLIDSPEYRCYEVYITTAEDLNIK